MLSVAVHKDIGEYKPKIVGKLTARTLVALTGAFGASLGTALWLYFVLGVNPGDYSFIIWGVSLPFWACGFWTPKGMPFEKFAPLWIRSKLTDDRIFYTPTMMLAGAVSNPAKRNRSKKNKEATNKYETKTHKLRGIEAYSPRAGRVIV